MRPRPRTRAPEGSSWLLGVALLVALSCTLSGSPALAQTNLRAWHEHGQTWIVWTDDREFSGWEHWEIHVSDQPISDLADAALLARTFPEDARADRLKLLGDARTWRVPDGAGGVYQLAPDEALFVHTPHEGEPAYFALVKAGETGVGPQNTTGPIAQGLDPVRCHEQWSGTTALGYPYTAWGLWIDGRDDHLDRRPDIDVMGNRDAHGTAHLFALFEPLGGRPPGLLPASLQLHGGGGNFTNWQPGNAGRVDNEVPGGFVVSLDSNLYLARTFLGSIRYVEAFNPWWFGHWEGYQRFAAPEAPPPPEGLIVDYSLRRVRFIIEWLLSNYPIDPERVSVLGHSMGAGGASFVARRHPDLIAAAIPFEHAHSGPIGFAEFLLGTRENDNPTSLPGGARMTEFFRPATLLEGRGDVGPITYVWGRNDPVLLWQLEPGEDVPTRMLELDATRSGAVMDWDERNHTRAEWAGALVGSRRHAARFIANERLGASFPAISGVDHDPAAGRQPDPGGGEPADGDPWGSWGGWVDWERESVEDSPERWAATLLLVDDAPLPADNAPPSPATLDVTIRRAAAFRPAPGTPLFHTLRSAEDDALLSSGPFAADALGLVSVEALTLPGAPARSRLTITPARDEDADGVDAQLDCDESEPGAWATPGPTRALLFATDRETLSWLAPEEPGAPLEALRDELLRAPGADAFASALFCVARELVTRSAKDPERPASGGAFFYLSRSTNACPLGLGSVGSDSRGMKREAAACP